MQYIFAFLFFLISLNTIAQAEKVVFNSVVTLEESVNDFKLTSNYYPLKSNIDNKNSVAYVSDTPTLDQIENAAINTVSDFFFVSKNKVANKKIMLINKPVRSYYVANLKTGEQLEFKCLLTGDITENRANEIINEKCDSSAKIENGKLYFNGKEFTIISTKKIRQDVLDLVTKNQLSKTETSKPKTSNTADLGKLVLTETKSGGKLDFFTPIKGKEFEKVQVKAGATATNIQAALYKWGRATFNMGIKTVQESLALFAKFRGRELTQTEKDHIKMGFQSGVKK